MKNSGITLVAMVITIIVMLILAGVSISMVVGDNGVLTKAQQGSVKTTLSSIESDIGLALNSVQTDFMAEFADSTSSAGNKNTYLTVKRLNDYLTECKLLYDCNIDEMDIKVSNKASYTSFKEKFALVPARVIKEESPLAYICADTVAIDPDVSNQVFKIKTGDSLNEKEFGAIESVGYACSFLFFSNGKDSKTFGGDLYVAIVHFENGNLMLDDIGVAKTKHKRGNGTQNAEEKARTLEQGQKVKDAEGTAENTTRKLVKELNVEWLNNIVDFEE